MRQPLTVIGVGLLLGAVVLAVGCGGMRVSWGKPEPATVFVVQQPEGQRFDYMVHVTNADPHMDMQAERFEAARKSLKGHCVPGRLVDLYAHSVGPRADGKGELLSYTIGVHCNPEGN
ncbi:MAG: hypothetical protein OEW11_05710 [Nitrospirota bacterium]|nr:hypothetical protein [Nitrospirota bacterium]